MEPPLELQALSYNELRALCKANGVRATGKKVDLVERLLSNQSIPELPAASAPDAENVEPAPPDSAVEMATAPPQSERLVSVEPAPKSSSSGKASSRETVTARKPQILRPGSAAKLSTVKPQARAQTAPATEANPTAETASKSADTLPRNPPKKFDLSKSLARPLSYKPYTGKLKPLPPMGSLR